MSISRKYRKEPGYPAFVEWINGPMTELPKKDLARGEPRIGAYEGVDEWFLYLLWKAASRPAVPDDFLQICQEEMARGSITSLPMKLGTMAARGFSSVTEVEEWMRTTRRNFVAAVTAATAGIPQTTATQPAQTGFRQVAIAGSLPGTTAWTTGVFNAEDVPLGSELYVKRNSQ